MGFVRLTSGRDAADSAYASIFGGVNPISRRLDVQPAVGRDGILRVPYRTTQALSTDQAAGLI